VLNVKKCLCWYSPIIELKNARWNIEMDPYTVFTTIWSISIVPLVFNLQNTWKWVASFTSCPLYPREITSDSHWEKGWLGSRAGPDALVKSKISDLYRESNVRGKSVLKKMLLRSLMLASAAVSSFDLSYVSLNNLFCTEGSSTSTKPVYLYPFTNWGTNMLIFTKLTRA